MDSLSVGIPSPPSIATGERGSQVNTDLRNDLPSRRPSFPPEGGRDQIGRVAGIRSVGWPPSGWNTWPPWIGIHTPDSGRSPGRDVCEGKGPLDVPVPGGRQPRPDDRLPALGQTRCRGGEAVLSQGVGAAAYGEPTHHHGRQECRLSEGCDRDEG